MEDIKNEEEEIVEDEEELEDDFDESEDDGIDWKAKALKMQGIAKRNATKLKKLKEAPKETAEETKPQDKKEEKSEEGLDLMQKAYLKASDIKSSEFPFVLEKMKETGKDLETLIESKYFVTELKEMREEAEAKDAMPTGENRSSASSRDSVEYWVAKGELPPADQVELRRKVVNAKAKQATDGSKFASQSVVK